MKHLKLTGLGSYTSPRLPGNPIQRGEVIRVDDDVAEDLLALKRDALEEDIQIPYFQVTEDAFTRNFSAVPVAAPVEAPFEPVPPPAAPVPAPAPVEPPAEPKVEEPKPDPTTEVGEKPAAAPKAAAPRVRQR